MSIQAGYNFYLPVSNSNRSYSKCYRKTGSTVVFRINMDGFLPVFIRIDTGHFTIALTAIPSHLQNRESNIQYSTNRKPERAKYSTNRKQCQRVGKAAARGLLREKPSIAQPHQGLSYQSYKFWASLMW